MSHSAKENANSNLDLILKLVPVYTVTLLLLEACKQYFYYLYFQFDILRYLNISYLFNSFLGSAASSIIVVLTVGAFGNFGDVIANFFRDPNKKAAPFKKKHSDKITNLTFAQKRNKVLQIRNRKIHLKKVGIYILAALFFFLLYVCLIYRPEFASIYFLTIINFLVIRTILLQQHHMNLENNLFKAYIFNYFIFTLIAIIVYSAFAFFPAYIKIIEPKQRNIQLIYENAEGKLDTLQPYSVRYYIGNTPEFYFIYNLMDSSTDVIPASSVKLLRSIKEVNLPLNSTTKKTKVKTE